MSEQISEQVKQQIILAAATVAGKDASPGDVTKQVERIAGFLNPNSEVRRAFVNLEKQAAATVKSSGFVATVIGFAKEETSNRGVVLFHSSVTEHTPEAKEFLRTDFLDDGGPVSQMMNKVRTELIGHKVQVSFDLVKKTGGSGHTVRVLTSITDRGVDEQYDVTNPAYQPVFYTDTDKARSTSKLKLFPRVPAAV